MKAIEKYETYINRNGNITVGELRIEMQKTMQNHHGCISK